MKKVPLANNVDAVVIARGTPGFLRARTWRI
jgi:ATP-dependent Zn protease